MINNSSKILPDVTSENGILCIFAPGIGLTTSFAPVLLLARTTVSGWLLGRRPGRLSGGANDSGFDAQFFWLDGEAYVVGI